MPSAKNLYHVYHNKLVKQSHSWEMTRLNIAPILETHSIPQRYENKLFSSSRLTELATSETDLYNSTTSSLMDLLCVGARTGARYWFSHHWKLQMTRLH